MTLDPGLEQPAHAIRPAIDGSDIRKMNADEAPTVARALARAFEDDPVWEWIFPRDTGRLAPRLERAFDFYLRRIWLAQDECYVPDRLFGAALWLPPGKWHLPPLAQLRLMPGMIAVNGRDIGRMMTLVRMIEKSHPRKPHYYLAVLGVEPKYQGRGFGSALMHPVLARCDRDQVPAYLESSKRRNVVLYERHGFKVVEELKLPRGGPPLWRMWREPAAQGVG